jgi:signal transduction histidine kinase
MSSSRVNEEVESMAMSIVTHSAGTRRPTAIPSHNREGVGIVNTSRVGLHPGGRQRGVRLGLEAVLALVAGFGSFTLSAALVGVAEPHVPVLALGVVYVFAVLAIARSWGIGYAVPFGVASVVAVDWYYLPPTHPLAVPTAEDFAALAVYLLSAVLLGQLAAHARRRADVSEVARSALADEQSALRSVATLVAREASPSAVFATVTEEVAQLLGAEVTSMLRYEPDGTATVVAARGEGGPPIPVNTRLTLEGENVAAIVLRTERAARKDTFEGATGSIAELLREIGVRSGVGSPIAVDGRLWGLMLAGSTRPEPLPSGTESRLGEFTELVATAISKAETEAELAASRARLVATGDETRRRFARDLHDGTQQRLVSLAFDVRAAKAMATDQPADLRDQLHRIEEGLIGALDDLREISRGIHPALLSEGGLGPALKALAHRSAVPVELDVLDVDRLPEQVEVAVYYVVSEALTNAAKHARATVVHVGVEIADATAKLSVRDDGIGGARPGLGSGLVGLRDRVEALRGRIEVSSPLGIGTSLAVTLPIG